MHNSSKQKQEQIYDIQIENLIKYLKKNKSDFAKNYDVTKIEYGYSVRKKNTYNATKQSLFLEGRRDDDGTWIPPYIIKYPEDMSPEEALLIYLGTRKNPEQEVYDREPEVAKSIISQLYSKEGKESNYLNWDKVKKELNENTKTLNIGDKQKAKPATPPQVNINKCKDATPSSRLSPKSTAFDDIKKVMKKIFRILF